MGQRIIRVNELLRREISQQLHTLYRGESVNITITGVDTSPDLHNARVYYSVIGDKLKEREAGRLFARIKKDLRMKVGKYITLKHLPILEFILDSSIERGVQLIDRMNEIDHEDNAR